MANFRLKKSGRKSAQTPLRMNFELECSCCDKQYLHRPVSGHPCEFVRRDEPSGKSLDIRALVGVKTTKKRKRRCWTESHSRMLAIILDVFGEGHLAVSRQIFEYTEQFLQRKVAEIQARRPRTVAPSPTPARATLVHCEELKQTPNLSTADKQWQLTPRFTPRMGQITCPEVLKFTPESCFNLSLRLGGESIVYNPLSAYNTCKFPDITADHLWEEKPCEAKHEGRWEQSVFPSPLGRPSTLVSPMLLSVKATPLQRMSFVQRVSKPIVERL